MLRRVGCQRFLFHIEIAQGQAKVFGSLLSFGQLLGLKFRLNGQSVDRRLSVADGFVGRCKMGFSCLKGAREGLVLLTGIVKQLTYLLLLACRLVQQNTGLCEHRLGLVHIVHVSLQFLVGLLSLFMEQHHLACIVFSLFFSIKHAVSVQLQIYLKRPDGLGQLRSLTAGESVNFSLQLGDSVVQAQKAFFVFTMLVDQVVACLNVLLTFVDVERQFVLDAGIARLKQQGVRGLDAVSDVACSLCDLFLSGKGLQTFFLLVLKQPNALKVRFDMLLLLRCLADFIVVGGHACHVIQHLTPLFCRHLGEAGHVALKDDVVTVGPGVGCTQQAMKHLLRAFLTVEQVGVHGIVGSRKTDVACHSNFVFFKRHTPSPTCHHRVGEHEGDGASTSRFRVFAAVEDEVG